jgi:hypothetical protein
MIRAGRGTWGALLDWAGAPQPEPRAAPTAPWPGVPLRVGYRLAPAFPRREAAGCGAGAWNGWNGWNGRSPGQAPGS